jgi:hypothetical protein
LILRRPDLLLEKSSPEKSCWTTSSFLLPSKLAAKMSGPKRQKVAHNELAQREPAEANASQTSPDPPTEEESVTLDVASSADVAEAPEEPKTFKELV